VPDIEELAKAVNEMWIDLYKGKDKQNPSVTARLVILEEAVERFAKNSSKLVWIGVAILGTLVVNLLTGHIGLK
jgi:hypothetical protein